MKLQTISLFIIIVILTMNTTHASGHTIEWTEQLGTSSTENSNGVSADGLGNVYISGRTDGSLGGANAGSADAFVSKYDSTGALLWTEQLGTSSFDDSWSVSADGLGNVYISGYTDGSLGGANAGGRDAFVSKYDSTGAMLWTEQFGTSSTDLSYGVSADGLGNIYISGSSDGSLGGANAGNYDAFISKYDSTGVLLWTEQLGTSSTDDSFSVSADGLGNVYITGRTNGSLGGANAGNYDAFISKYDSTGVLLWTEQLGSSATDISNGVSADGLGNVYIGGYTRDTLGVANAGGDDAFVSKYDSTGTLLWTEQLGSSSSDYGLSISADGHGNVYISGYTYGNLDGANAGSTDAFVSKYDATGTLLWTEQLGTSTSDFNRSISADGFGNIYISGSTNGSLSGANAGSTDAFLVKLHDPTVVPEPQTLALGAFACVFSLARCRRKSR